MKKSQLLISLLAILSFIISHPRAAAYDSDTQGYPILYLRGTQDGTAWKCDDRYKFTRTGNTYTLTLDHLLADFNVADRTWQVTFGSLAGALKLARAGESFAVGKNGTVRNIRCTGLADVTLTLEYTSTTKATLTITGTPEIPASYTLPILHVDVLDADGRYNDEVADYNLAHKEYFDAQYWIDNAGKNNIGSADAPLKTQIKARGNYTRQKYIKKPFKLKLDKKQALLGLSKSKHFALLAHADDSVGFLHNYVAFNLGERLKLPWTPHVQPIELVLNGDYRGVYFMTESIRVEKDRIDIAELNDGEEDATLVSGGYVVEFDNYTEENQIVMAEKSNVPGDWARTIRITFDTPEVYSDLQRRFVTDQFNAMNDAIGRGSDDIWKYLDMDDAARYYLACEIAGHTEAYGGSTYLHRDRGEGQKWHFGPLWDFGHAFEVPLYTHVEKSGPFGHTWIKQLKTNAKFCDKVKETWKWLMGNDFDSLYDQMYSFVSNLKPAALADTRRWSGTEKPDFPNGLNVRCNPDLLTDMSKAASYIETRCNWLVKEYGSYSPASPEPARDTTPAAPLPDYAQTSVHETLCDGMAPDDTPAEYYTIDGIRVAEPRPGTLYIVRRGPHATKLLIR